MVIIKVLEKMKKSLSKLKFYINDRGIFIYILSLIFTAIYDLTIQHLWRIELYLRGVTLEKFFIFKIIGRPIVSRVPGSIIKLGKSVTLMSSSRRCLSASLNSACKLSTIYRSASIVLEDGVSLNGASIVSRSKSIHIGKNTMIGPNCVIMDSPFHHVKPADNRNLYSGFELDQDIKIGKNVWLGANVLILAGSIIGDNSVVGAGSVVKGCIPPNCVSAGAIVEIKRFFED